MVAAVSHRCFYFLSERVAVRDSGLCFREQISAPRENVIRLRWWPDRDGEGSTGEKKASRGTKKKVAGTMMKKIHQFSRCGLRGARGAS